MKAKLARAVLALAALIALYALASSLGQRWLPHRVWLGTHYIDDLELLPTFSSLGEEMIFLVQSGILVSSIAVSVGRVLLGFVLGAVIGTLLGFATGRAARLEYLVEPWVGLLRFTPAIALLPLFVLWFGFGEGSKVLLIATSVGVIALMGAHQGVRAVPRVYLEAAASLGAGDKLIFRKVVLPLAFPQVFSSLRVALGLAWVTIVVAELIDPKMPSLGYLLALAGAYPRVPTMLIGIITVGALVLLFDVAALAAHARATRWMTRAE